MAPTPIRLQKFLAGVRYPARKGQVLERAVQRGADTQVLDALRGLPDDEYASPIALSCAVGRHLERR